MNFVILLSYLFQYASELSTSIAVWNKYLDKVAVDLNLPFPSANRALHTTAPCLDLAPLVSLLPRPYSPETEGPLFRVQLYSAYIFTCTWNFVCHLTVSHGLRMLKGERNVLSQAGVIRERKIKEDGMGGIY